MTSVSVLSHSICLHHTSVPLCPFVSSRLTSPGYPGSDRRTPQDFQADPHGKDTIWLSPKCVRVCRITAFVGFGSSASERCDSRRLFLEDPFWKAAGSTDGAFTSRVTAPAVKAATVSVRLHVRSLTSELPSGSFPRGTPVLCHTDTPLPCRCHLGFSEHSALLHPSASC